MFYPQNGDRIVTIDSVTSLHCVGAYIDQCVRLVAQEKLRLAR